MNNPENNRFKRKTVQDAVITDILIKCRRRCCMCYTLNCDDSEKKGQIAHIDRNPANNAEDNLAYLCLKHHDLYDGHPSQSKHFTPSEIKHYKRVLYKKLGTLCTQWQFIIEGKLDSSTLNKISEIMDNVRKYADDVDIHIKDISEGSIVITLESTEKVYQKLRSAFEMGTLSKDLNIPIVAVMQTAKPNVASLVALGKDLLKEKKVDEAISCANMAIEKDPDDTFAWSLKATSMIAKFYLHEKDKSDKGRMMQAYCYVRRIHDMLPNSPSNLVNEGIIFYELGKYDKALLCFDKATKISPEYAFAWYNKGLLLISLNRPSEAIKPLEIAAKLGYEKALSALNTAKRKYKRFR